MYSEVTFGNKAFEFSTFLIFCLFKLDINAYFRENEIIWHNSQSFPLLKRPGIFLVKLMNTHEGTVVKCLHLHSRVGATEFNLVISQRPLHLVVCAEWAPTGQTIVRGDPGTLSAFYLLFLRKAFLAV